MPTITYDKFPHGVINDIERSEIPHDAVFKSDKFYYRENFWRKIPGLVELNSSAVEANPIWSITVYHQLLPRKDIKMIATGSDVYIYDDSTQAFSSIFSGLVPNQQVEFIEHNSKIYFGSVENLWRRYDGGSKTYSVGGANGAADDAPRKFSQILFNPYSGRFFGIGQLTNPDYLYWSAHTDDEGIEKWPGANIQVVESVLGDTPQKIDIFEGRINIFNQHSIHSGNVIGVPEVWSFQREKAQSGTISGRTVKRYGNSFLMFTPEFELYAWPQDKFLSKGKVKFYPDPNFAHLAWAEIVEDRYYYLCFKSNQQVSSDKYHLWIYDILGDRFYGPHTQYNAVSGHYDNNERLLYMGGADDLEGFFLEHRGKNIKNASMNCHIIGSYSDQGDPVAEKRYEKVHIKMKQEGSLANGEGQLELIINVDNRYNNPQSQRITLEDPAGQNFSESSAVKEAITKRMHIHDGFGRGNAINWEIKHNVRNADFAFSRIDIDYMLRRYRKENRGV